jgi:hypothetical protein
MYQIEHTGESMLIVDIQLPIQLRTSMLCAPAHT